MVALVAGVLACLLSWGAGEGVLGFFQPKRVPNPANAIEVPIENAELHSTDVKNAALTYGLEGAILGLVLGLAGAAAARSARSALLAGLTGLVIGAAVGTAVSLGAFTAYFRLSAAYQGKLLPSVLAHIAAWAPIGAAAGLAFGLGLGLGQRGRVVSALVGGLAGAVVGALLYDVVGSAVFPSSRTGGPVATRTSARLLAHGAVGILAALGAAFFAEAATRRAR